MTRLALHKNLDISPSEKFIIFFEIAFFGGGVVLGIFSTWNYFQLVGYNPLDIASCSKMAILGITFKFLKERK